MRTILMSAGLATAIAGGAAITAAPEQVRPGELTKGEVWIQNRGPAEAIPVTIQEVAPTRTIRVAVVNGEGLGGEPGPLRMRIVAPVWEYQTAQIPRGAPPAPILNPLGVSGWETTGIVWPTSDGGTTVLLKRTR